MLILGIETSCAPQTHQECRKLSLPIPEGADPLSAASTHKVWRSPGRTPRSGQQRKPR